MNLLAFTIALCAAAAPPPESSSTPSSPSARPEGPAVRRGPLDRDSVFVPIYLSATLAGGEHVYEAHAGIGQFLLDHLSVELDVVAGLVGYGSRRAAVDRTWDAGSDVLWRWHFLRFDTSSIYADGGVGVRVFGSEFPVRGTKFNFSLQAGSGARLQLREPFALIAGLRWFHTSNAALWGRRRNPAHNALQFSLGSQFNW